MSIVKAGEYEEVFEPFMYLGENRYLIYTYNEYANAIYDYMKYRDPSPRYLITIDEMRRLVDENPLPTTFPCEMRVFKTGESIDRGRITVNIKFIDDLAKFRRSLGK